MSVVIINRLFQAGRVGNGRRAELIKIFLGDPKKTKEHKKSIFLSFQP